MLFVILYWAQSSIFIFKWSDLYILALKRLKNSTANDSEKTEYWSLATDLFKLNLLDF